MTDSTALVPATHHQTTELALPDELIRKAKSYAVNARSERTRKEYGRCWRQFTAWCEANGREPLPAGVETVAAYITVLAEHGGPKGKPLAITSINQALSAIKLAHRTAGHGVDWDSLILKEVWQGIRREVAKTRTVRRAKPLLAEHLKEIIDSLDLEVLRECRDAALLSLLWAGALRRSELVGLDWHTLGSGSGFVKLDDEGITITLMTSKASQDEAETVVVPRIDMPTACTLLNAWVQKASIAHGSPIFRGITGKKDGKSVAATRLDDRSVSRIMKQRVKVLAKARSGRKRLTKDEMKALVDGYSGHSGRAGYVTSAARRNLSDRRIQMQTRHKSAEMLSVYVREGNKMANSGLKGVGF